MNLIEREFCDSLTILSDFKEAKYIVAFSGGTDSLALLALCSKALKKNQVIPVYVNHNLRSSRELSREIELNKANCKTLGFDLIVREIERGQLQHSSKNVGIEAAARKKRYALLEEECVQNNCDYILTAHHRDDQVETVLMKLISKAPITGLRGISQRWNNTLRPLLEFSKQDLKEYVLSLGLRASEDSTNKDNSFTRNEIRNEILPELKQIMPDCEKRILNIRDKAVSMCSSVEDVYDRIKLSTYRDYNEAQKEMVLFQMWDNVVGSMMPQTLIKRVEEKARNDRAEKVSANGGTFYSYNGILYIVNESDFEKFANFKKDFDFECQKNYLPSNLVIERTREGKSTDISLSPELFKGKVILRFPFKGEMIKLKGGSKTINKLLKDMKIPEVFRNRVPVLADDDGLCVVFGSVYGGRDRICAKLRSSLALSNYYKYICYKGENRYEQ